MKSAVDEHPLLKDLDSARDFLGGKYASLGFQVHDEGADGLCISLPPSEAKRTIKTAEITEYRECSQQFGNFENAPNECSICSRDYREQLVEGIGRWSRILSLQLRSRDRIVKFSGEDPTYVEYGLVTPLYRHYLRFTEHVLEEMRMRFKYGLFSENRPGWLDRMLTVRVGNIGAETVQDAVERSTKLIESSLFSMSYLDNRPMAIVSNWSHPVGRRPDRFHFGERASGLNFPLPRAYYNTDMMRYYQLGVSSEDPILRFLAFYQVLEYLFVAVSDEKLYQRLQHRLRDPKFSASPRHLDKIIQEVDNYRRETDEEKRLRNVLEKYVEEEELIQFISEYESYLGEKHYSSQRNLFGVNIKVTLEKGHVYSNVASVIKTVRNALVHSSDRYDREERHIPFSESTEIVRKEIPLLRYLAEKVVVGSAQELPEFKRRDSGVEEQFRPRV